jgi:5,10-methylenetetrahydromethanopterin reductase
VKIGVGVGWGPSAVTRTTEGFERGIGVWLDNLHLAEEVGFDVIGLGDSQAVEPELYTMMAIAARETSKALLSPMTTNPVTRHPAVATAAIASVDALSGGRARFGIGRGGSAVRNVGVPPAKESLLRPYILACHDLMRGETVDWMGKPMLTPWITRPVPIILSAYGPKTLRMAGEIADGVIICGGVEPTVLGQSIEIVRDGARSMGRDPSEVEIWVMTRGAVRDTFEEAVADIEANVASGARLLPLDTVPEELRPVILEMRSRYDDSRHVEVAGNNAQLARELGLTDYLIDRLSICGTPEMCREKVAAIEHLGIDVLYFAGSVREPANLIRRMGTEVFGDRN